MITRAVLPPSFLKDGFVDPNVARREGRKFRRLMIGTDGPWDSGKTEFALSAPGPGMALCLDRNFDSIFDNPKPPKSRRNDWGFKVVKVPKQSSIAVTDKSNGYLDYWREFTKPLYLACDNPDCRTILLDGDSDSWELQRLAEFKGQLTQIPPMMYSSANAARRALYARLFDTGKIIIATNRIKKQYEAVIDPATQQVKMSNSGQEVREWTGDFERSGFADQDYLWNIQLRHMREDTETGPRWGIKIMKCKADPTMEGQELWGDECNFQTLVQLIYPDVPLSEWGY